MRKCNLCGGKVARRLASRIREGAGRIVRCAGCGLVRQDLDWSEARLRRYYNEIYQRTNSLDARATQSPRRHFESRRRTLGPILDRLRPLLRRSMRVLDLGCGAGELLHALRPKVREVVGFEIHEAFVSFMRRRLGIEAYADDFSTFDFGSRRFDLVLSIDALDHLPDPKNALLAVRRCLAPGGTVYLEVPNLDEALNRSLPSPTRESYQRFFWHRAHFSYFSQETLSTMLAATGFTSTFSCRHQYTLKNFLNWYFRGKPQTTFLDAATNIAWFPGRDAFERGMNRAFQTMERSFHALLEKTGRGDTLCVTARPRPGDGWNV